MTPEEIQAKLQTIESAFFVDSKSLIIDEDMEAIPLVVASVSKATRSFSKDQTLYIYDAYWGMNERVKVIGRYRRKHRLVQGVCPWVNLKSYRPTIVYDPNIIQRLKGKTITFNFITLTSKQ